LKGEGESGDHPAMRSLPIRLSFLFLAWAGLPAGLAAQAAPAAPAAEAPRWENLPPLSIGPHTFHRRRLANGLLALAVPDVGNDVSVFMVVGAGRRQESATTTGLAHLVEHTLYTGSRALGAGEHDKQIHGMGGESNAFTRDDYTLYYDHQIPADRLTDVLRFEADRLRYLSFDEAPFLHERDRLRDEEKRTFSPSAARDELIEAAVFRAHPYGAGVYDAAGFTQGPQLPIELVKTFYDLYYRPERVAVVVAGAVEPALALDSIWVAFGGLERGKEPPSLPQEPAAARGGSLRFASELERPLVTWAWLAPPLGDPDRPALEVLAWLLGHEVAADGRQLRAAMGDRVDADIFRVQATGGEAAQHLSTALRKAFEQPWPAASIAEAKASLRDEFLSLGLRGRPYFSLAAQVGVYSVFGFGEYAAGYAEKIDAVSEAELQRVARRYLTGERRFEIVFEAKGEPPPPLPEDPHALAKAAEEAESAGDYDRAIDAYTRLLQTKPNKMNTVIYLATRGQIHLEKRDYAAAIGDFEDALKVVDYPAVRDLLEEARRRQLAPEEKAAPPKQ
jgi:zinc protease